MAGSDGFERGLEVGAGVDLIHFGELSHEPTRQRERTMRGFKSMGQAQRFLAVHGTMKNLYCNPATPDARKTLSAITKRSI